MNAAWVVRGWRFSSSVLTNLASLITDASKRANSSNWLCVVLQIEVKVHNAKQCVSRVHTCAMVMARWMERWPNEILFSFMSLRLVSKKIRTDATPITGVPTAQSWPDTDDCSGDSSAETNTHTHASKVGQGKGAELDRQRQKPQAATHTRTHTSAEFGMARQPIQGTIRELVNAARKRGLVRHTSLIVLTARRPFQRRWSYECGVEMAGVSCLLADGSLHTTDCESKT